MLRLMLMVKGRPPHKLIRAHIRAYEILNLEPHFEPDLRFRQWDADPVTGKPFLKLVEVAATPPLQLETTLLSSKAGADDRKMVVQLADLLDKCLTLDPGKRCSVNEALKHALFTSSTTTTNGTTGNKK